MGKRSYPPLKQGEIVEIMLALGFMPKKQTGSHVMYERPADARMPRRVVPIDDYKEFDQSLIKRIIRQTGFSRREFYGAIGRENG
jgi:predicted RNA binding protein YcfA (HicA-like mRNA interferase family)